MTTYFSGVNQIGDDQARSKTIDPGFQRLADLPPLRGCSGGWRLFVSTSAIGVDDFRVTRARCLWIMLTASLVVMIRCLVPEKGTFGNCRSNSRLSTPESYCPCEAVSMLESASPMLKLAAFDRGGNSSNVLRN